ncbi:predicted protein [Chaetomium globosum CBS 148.51]|uniref:Zn(2)-C6 fungal-type domain-containing protein n=1 Tax=Chaetomium globosum (strain ATCC 6205 / CBS 148.51 / DSM 1962 / NBRC 6347 / NRRL 1970) TaxID=306901 RepID=Q2H5S8_CHAGB|nr:uncharacterized protein CHGG_05987 [Chaetomium globosum CBS 148.51]EAQ89368.1 predicted protein [Chaetomium globosum CBS 148.51]
MADVAEAARKQCHSCGLKKAIDQFYALRGPRRIVADCLDCRNRKRREDTTSTSRISAASAIARGQSLALGPAPPPRQNLTHGVLAERYHEGGRVATDTLEMAAARTEVSAIQRRHRFERRHGEGPSQTPDMSDLLRQQQPADKASTLPPSAPPQVLQDPGSDLPPSAQPRKPEGQGAQDEEMEAVDHNQRSVPPRLPRIGHMLPRRRPPPSPSSPARGRSRGRPRLARNPVGRPRRQPFPEERTPRKFDKPSSRFTGDDQESPLNEEDLAIKREFDEALAAEEMRYCCDGNLPCQRCNDAGDECKYNYVRQESKGQLRAETEQLRQNNADSDALLRAIASIPDPHVCKAVMQGLLDGSISRHDILKHAQFYSPKPDSGTTLQQPEPTSPRSTSTSCFEQLLSWQSCLPHLQGDHDRQLETRGASRATSVQPTSLLLPHLPLDAYTTQSHIDPWTKTGWTNAHIRHLIDALRTWDHLPFCLLFPRTSFCRDYTSGSNPGFCSSALVHAHPSAVGFA